MKKQYGEDKRMGQKRRDGRGVNSAVAGVGTAGAMRRDWSFNEARVVGREVGAKRRSE